MIREYSIWLVPRGKDYRTLQRVMSDLQTKHNSPQFGPHVTLIGKLDMPPELMIEKTKQLASRLTPFEVKLGGIDALKDYYYKCLFARVTQTAELLEANEIAQRTFGTKERYEPHLSLVYGYFPPEIKDATLKDISHKLDVSFRSDELYLFSTADGVANWYELGRFPMRDWYLGKANR